RRSAWTRRKENGGTSSSKSATRPHTRLSWSGWDSARKRLIAPGQSLDNPHEAWSRPWRRHASLAMKTYSISKLARTCDLSRSTLLYYDRLGLLKPSGRTASGYRYYTDADQRR